MSEQQYEPTGRFDNVNTLLGNHFRFTIEALPDLTFFAQSFEIPGLSIAPIKRHTPFTHIAEVGDHIDFSNFNVSYLIDNAFKTYFSLFAWLKGYGFPKDYDQIEAFGTARKSRLPNPKPALREIQKTNATLYVLQPDTETTVAELFFEDVFPSALGQVAFTTTGGAPDNLSTMVTFNFTDFDIRLT